MPMNMYLYYGQFFRFTLNYVKKKMISSDQTRYINKNTKNIVFTFNNICSVEKIRIENVFD